MKPGMKIERNLFVILFAFVTLSLLMSSCTNVKNSGQSDINKGYGFISVNIDPIIPNNVIYIDNLQQTTDISAKLTNDMYMPATNIKVKATNYNNDAIGLDAFNAITDSPLSMHGYTQQYGQKDYGALEAPVTLRTVRNQPYTANIHFYLCADAMTYYQDSICLAPTGSADSYDKTCSPGNKAVSGGQGAPVAVTSVKTLSTQSSITFILKVVNKGNGLVYRKSDQSSCTYISQNDAGYIKLDYFEVGGKLISGCIGKEARMGYDLSYQKNAGATFTCTVSRSLIGMDNQASTVSESLVAEFAYSYNEQLPSQNVIIKNAPGYTYSDSDYNNAIGSASSGQGQYVGTNSVGVAPGSSFNSQPGSTGQYDVNS